MIINVIIVVIVIFIMMAERGRVLESKGRCSGKLGEKSDWNEDGGRKLKQKPHNLIILAIIIIVVILIMVIMVVMFEKLII